MSEKPTVDNDLDEDIVSEDIEPIEDIVVEDDILTDADESNENDSQK